MSDEPITVPQSDRQSAVDAVIAAVSTNRGTPEVTVAVPRTPSMSYNTATGEISYHSEEDRQLAERPGAPSDTMDERDPSHEFKTVLDSITAEDAKLQKHSFDAKTGAKVYALPEGSEARRVQQLRVQQLCETAAYQETVYRNALEARAARDAAGVRRNEATAIGQAWTGGDPARQAALDKAVVDAEARHIADAMIRAKLGNLSS